MIYEKLGILAMMVGCGALGAVGTVYLRPVPNIQDAPVQAFVPAPIPYVPAPVRDVAWFKANQPEMQAKLAGCNNNPGLAMSDPECMNADKASSDISIDKLLASMPK
jgi:hypothetical protein